MWTPNELHIFLALSAFTFCVAIITIHSMVICYLLFILVLIFSIIFACNGAYENLKPIFKVMLQLELEVSDNIILIVKNYNIKTFIKCDYWDIIYDQPNIESSCNKTEKV